MATATADRETSHGLVVETVRKEYQEGPMDFDIDLDCSIEEARDGVRKVAVQNPKGHRVNEFVVESVKEIVYGTPGATKYAIDFVLGEDIGHVDPAYLFNRFRAAARGGELPEGMYLDGMRLAVAKGEDLFSLVLKYR